VSRGQRGGSLTVVNLSFLDRTAEYYTCDISITGEEVNNYQQWKCICVYIDNTVILRRFDVERSALSSNAMPLFMAATRSVCSKERHVQLSGLRDRKVPRGKQLIRES
jgi:hypothetical protein